MKALITGSNRGIGLELSRQLLEQGWQVFATCRNPVSALKLKELGAEYQGHVAIMQLDVYGDCILNSGDEICTSDD